MYDIFDRAHRRYRAYRIVVDTGEQGQYYGIQGTNWKAPPILDNPSTTTRMRGRTYELFYDGNRLRLVALADAARRLLGVEHAVPHAHEPADARDRPVAEPGRRAAERVRDPPGERPHAVTPEAPAILVRRS